MSVFLAVKMDVAIGDKDFDTVTQEAFPMEGVARMRSLPTLQWKIWGGWILKDDRQADSIYLRAVKLQKAMHISV